ncbi:MAG: uroporphyrinogen decarboxylase family protein [Verrucomicrobiota bacterium]
MRENSERLMKLLRGGRVDRPPFYEPWFGMGEMLNRRYAGNYIRMADDLGHAAVPVWGYNAEVDFIHHDIRTEAGAYYHGGSLREARQLRERPEPDFAAQIEPMLAYRRECANAGIACWMVIGWCFDRVAASMGLENLALACYDQPEFIHEAMQWVETRNQHGIEQVIAKVRPDFVLYNGDCAYKTGLMIAPAMLRDFCLEPTRRTVQMIHDLGIPFAFHTDGQLDDIVPMLIELGICAVHGCEKQANDLGHLVEKFGDDIALCGNMDVVFLKNATPDQVRAETLEMLRIGNAKRRFIAGCNTSPQDYIPDENYRTFLHTVRDWQPASAA